MRKGVDETAAVNSAGGVLSVTNTGTSNGVQGRTADINSGGVYGENTSGEGYGIGGRAGQGGIGVYGDNTGTGWAGYFQGNVHIDVLDLGGALNCTECVHTGDVAGGYIQGGGKAAGQAVAIGPGAHYFLGPALTGFLRLSYECPATLTDNGTLHVYNDSGSPANVFVESGYPNPNYFVMPASGPGQELTFPASATGDSWHIQAQGALGVLTIEAASVHRASDCHAQAQALLTG